MIQQYQLHLCIPHFKIDVSKAYDQVTTESTIKNALQTLSTQQPSSEQSSVIELFENEQSLLNPKFREDIGKIYAALVRRQMESKLATKCALYCPEPPEPKATLARTRMKLVKQ